MFRLSLLFAFLATVGAFQVSMPVSRPMMTASASSTTTARYVLLSDEEAASIMASAQDCAEGECSVDDVADLIAELKEQQALMEERLGLVMNAVAHLQHIAPKIQKKDEVKALVKDLLRVFSSSGQAFSASGFSGDIPKKTLTAYDALPPKKMKKST